MKLEVVAFFVGILALLLIDLSLLIKGKQIQALEERMDRIEVLLGR